jgi:VCBS repeat-containing protein
MYDTLEKERRLIVGSSDTGHNGGGEQEPPESTAHETQPIETVHIHYFPDAIVICKEEEADRQEDNLIEATLVQPTKPPVFIANATCTFYLLLILSCIAFQVYEILNPPIATVTIIPTLQTVTLTGTLQIGRLLHPLTVSQSQTTPTTGTGHQDATAATGFLTFYNGQFASQTIAAGTVLTGASGVQIVTDQEAHIPAANPPIFGQVTVSAHALNPGSRGNIPGYGINQACCANAVLAKNTQPFTGGQEERNFQTVAKADIATTAAPLKTAVAQSMSAALQSQLTPQEQLSLLPCPPHVTSDHQPGQEATQVKVTVSQTCSAVAYNREELEKKATVFLATQAHQKTGAGYILFGTVHVSVRQATMTSTPHPLVFLSFHAQGTWFYGLTHTAQEQIKHLIAGKSTQEAVTLLASLPGVEHAAIRFTGFGDESRLPKDTRYISITLVIV